MVSPLFYYQLALLAIIWLFVMLHFTWTRQSATTTTAPATPITPKRPRSTAPKAFEGLTHKPHCALCERDTVQPKAPPPTRPAPLPPTNRRPREVDTSMHFCPHSDCDYRGWQGLSNLRANGHPSGSPWRQFHCLGCNGYFSEHHGTMFHGKQAAVELIVRVLACVAEGLGIRATARVFEADPNTVWAGSWRQPITSKPSRATSCTTLTSEQVQMDELFALLSAVKDGESAARQAIKRLSRSPHWVWVAMDPVYKLILAADVGDRTLAMAQRLVPQVTEVLAPHCAPLFLTDGFRESLTALVTHYGQVRHVSRLKGVIIR